MKRKYFMGIIFVMIFMLSMGAITASDLNQTDAVNDSGSKSFYELNETIYGHDECDLDSDYEFAEESDGDFVQGIVITGNTTINGHNHFVDCKNIAVGFNVTLASLYVNDLTIKNGNINMIRVDTGKCVLNNVKFIYKLFIR